MNTISENIKNSITTRALSILSVLKSNNYLYYESTKSIIYVECLLLEMFRDDIIFIKPTSPLMNVYHDIDLMNNRLSENIMAFGKFENLIYCDWLGMNLSQSISESIMNPDKKIIVMCGDGEMQESIALEALFTIERMNLSNISIIVDNNKKQKLTETIFPNFGLTFENIIVDSCSIYDIQAVYDMIHLNQPTVTVLGGV